MAHEALHAQDATLLCAQDPAAPLQIGALCLFEATPWMDDRGVLRFDDLTRHIEHRLSAQPDFRRRLAPVLFDQLPPVWVEDDRFDITYHVRRAELPAPGDDAQLRAFLVRLVEQPLDPTHPLWQVWFVEGVRDDRVALILKASHVLADGIALLDFAFSVLDAEPDAVPAAAPPSAGRGPRPPTAAIPLLADAVVERTRRRVEMVGRSLAALAHPGKVLGVTTALLRSGLSWPSRGPAPSLPITGSVGGRRDVIWLRLPMSGLVETKRALEVSLNDVVLAIVTGGLREYLAHHDVDIDTVRPRVLVPVSTHGVAAEHEIENRFSMMLAELPVDVADPIERVRHIHDEMVQRKSSAARPLMERLFDVSDLVPVALLRAVGPPLLRRQPFVNLAVTNLPGTEQPLYLLGSKMIELFPFISVTGNIAMIIGVLSYQDGLGVGITVDADVVRDVDELAAAIDSAARDLMRNATTRRSPAAVRVSRTPAAR